MKRAKFWSNGIHATHKRSCILNKRRVLMMDLGTSRCNTPSGDYSSPARKVSIAQLLEIHARGQNSKLYVRHA
jgi:hypothetical protein